MSYKCHCGAPLSYANTGVWSCPNGHQVYLCSNCLTLNKKTPLQWIPQYQRWFCFECRQYAPSTSSTRASENAGVGSTAQSVSEDISRRLHTGEQALFFSGKAEVKTTQAFAHNTGDSVTYLKTVYIGEFAITDRRLLLVSPGPLSFRVEFLPASSLLHYGVFEAIYDPKCARETIESAKATNRDLLDRAKQISPFKRSKFLMSPEYKNAYRRTVDILVSASLEKSLIGEEYLKLKLNRIWIGKNVSRAAKAVTGFALGLQKVGSLGYDARKPEYELRLKTPLGLMTSTFLVASAISSIEGQFLSTLVNHYKSRPHIAYEPILEIVEGKANELASMAKDLDDLAD